MTPVQPVDVNVGASQRTDSHAPDYESAVYDVVIVGAGPVGLTLANALHQLLSLNPQRSKTADALSILVLDHAPQLSRISKAIAIHARTHETLALLGSQARIPEKLINDPLPNVDDASPNRGAVPHAIHLRDQAGTLLAEMYPLSPSMAQSPFPFITMRSQVDTERVLYDDLLGRQQQSAATSVNVQVQFNSQITGIRFDPCPSTPSAPVVIDVASSPSFPSRTIRTAYVVGCDGGRSTVRHLLSIPFPGTTRHEVMWLCDARITTNRGLPIRLSPKTGPALMSMHLHPTYGMMIVFPLQDGKDAPDGGYYRIALFGGDQQAHDLFGSVDAALEGVQDNTAQAADTATQFINKQGTGSVATGTPTLAALQAMFNQRFQVPYASAVAPGHLANLAAEDQAHTAYTLVDCTWRTRFRVNERVADTYVAGVPGDDPTAAPRVLLAGDACHVHSPMGGQGMNLGIQDAGNLAFKLALVLRGHVRDAARALRTYETERRPQAQAIVAMTSALTDWAARRPWLVKWVLGSVVPWIVAKWPGLVRPEAAARNAGLEVVYGADGWIDGTWRVTKGSGGVALRYPVGHRAPTRATLQPYPPPPESAHPVPSITPLDLYVDTGLGFTVLVLYPATTAGAKPDQGFLLPGLFATSSLVKVHHVALLTSPPQAVHVLDLPPRPMLVTGSQARVHNQMACNVSDPIHDYQAEIMLQTAIAKEWGNRWIDADGSVAKFLFGVTHDPSFGESSPHRPWVVVVRPDGVMSMCGLGIEPGQVLEHLQEFLDI